ncbi:MAG: heavy metal-responsive transcriptional regulator [Planctomycetes bacterium]|nr:heavy metal-responsive transcriptional regulator [Planctomycetota bacterium]
MKLLTIGQIAIRSGVGIETVRFYEREGLLAKPERTQSGYRQFDEEVISRLMFIQRAKELGFTLNEIKELLSLRIEPGTCCKNVRAKAESKIAAVEGKIRMLQRMKKALVRLTQECCEKGGGSECPILDALDGRPRTSRRRG